MPSRVAACCWPSEFLERPAEPARHRVPKAATEPQLGPRVQDHDVVTVKPRLQLANRAEPNDGRPVDLNESGRVEPTRRLSQRFPRAPDTIAAVHHHMVIIRLDPIDRLLIDQLNLGVDLERERTIHRCGGRRRRLTVQPLESDALASTRHGFANSLSTDRLRDIVQSPSLERAQAIQSVAMTMPAAARYDDCVDLADSFGAKGGEWLGSRSGRGEHSERR